MGRKAKLKIAKKQTDSQQETALDRDRFVETFQRQGYRFGQFDRAPEVPENRPEPQV